MFYDVLWLQWVIFVIVFWLMQKSHSVELTLDLIPDFMCSLVGFMYPLGGIKSGVNSIACARCGARIRERSR